MIYVYIIQVYIYITHLATKKFDQIPDLTSSFVCFCLQFSQKVQSFTPTRKHTKRSESVARLTAGPVTVMKHEINVFGQQRANIELSPKARCNSGFVPSQARCVALGLCYSESKTLSPLAAVKKVSCLSTSGVLNLFFRPVFIVLLDIYVCIYECCTINSLGYDTHIC